MKFITEVLWQIAKGILLVAVLLSLWLWSQS